MRLKNLIKEFGDKELATLIKSPVTRVQLSKYAGASGDFNPVHIDEKFAEESPFGGVIAHGMLSMGFLGQYMEQLAGDDYEVQMFKVQFRSIVRPGDTITCESEVIEVTEEQAIFSIKAKNQKKETVVTGKATIMKKK